MKIKIELTQLTLDDQINLSDGMTDPRLRREMFSHLVVDDDGSKANPEQAVKFAGALTIKQQNQIIEEIGKVIAGTISPEAGGG